MSRITSICLAVSLPVLGVPLLSGASNRVTLTDLTGVRQSARPTTISRVFAQGEIPNFPQPILDGTPLAAWQADVKNRWPDGSAKHVMISFFTSVAANGSAAVTFQNNSSQNSGGAALTQSQMLGFLGGNWDVDIEITGSATCSLNQLSGNTCAADARTMMAAGNWRYWLQGPVATQVIVEDRTPTLTHDMGFSASQSLHPIFVLTFYPGFAGVKEEAILENCWTTKLQDVSYSVAVKSGQGLANTQYNRSTFNHYAGGRWRRVFWDGAAPGSVKTDLNLPYLISSLSLPNFDTSLIVGASAIGLEVNEFKSGDKGDAYGSHGQWATYFPMTGGRPDIGWTPRWNARYLYSFDPSLQPVVEGNAAVSGYVPIHFRESRNDSKKFCAISCTGANVTAPAFGHPLSNEARPTIWAGYWTNSGTTAGDAVISTGPMTAGPWSVDQAHQGDFSYVPYLLSGDWYMLEEIYFWNSFNVASGNPTLDQGYASHADWSFFNFNGIQSRGVAWALRSLGNAVFIVPDNTPEQQYFISKLKSNIAILEGFLQITNGSFPPANSACPNYDPNTTNDHWCWGKVTVGNNMPNPLHFPSFDSGTTPDSDQNLLASTVDQVASPWMDNYHRIVVGRIREVFPQMAAVHDALSINLMHLAADPAANGPWMLNDYRIPVIQNSTHKYYTSWSDWLASYTPSARAATGWINTGPSNSPLYDVENGYALIARAAASFITPALTDGTLTSAGAWALLNSPANGISNQPGLGTNIANCATAVTSPQVSQCDNPKWAFVPRNITVAPPPPSNPCDINNDNVVNQTDVLLAIDQTLGKTACNTADLLKNGVCNILNVQRIIVAALGGICRTTP